MYTNVYKYVLVDITLMYVHILLISRSADACVTFYLRGRAVNFYAPTTTGIQNGGEPIPLPKAKLSLEWAYPFCCTLAELISVETQTNIGRYLMFLGGSW